MTVEDILNYTDERIVNWYKTVKEDYGVEGSGKTWYKPENSEIGVNYEENGVKKTWSMFFEPSECLCNGLEWVFNCWSELAE